MDLRSLRKRAGYTQQRLAAIAHVRTTTICDLERGKIPSPHYKTVANLAAALELTVAEVAAAIESSRA